MEDPIPFVQRIPRASGKVDAYFRHRPTGYRKRLQSPYGSEAMRAEVDAILASLAAVERAQTPRAGTVGQMLKGYAGAPGEAGQRVKPSAKFLALARSTQGEYARIADELVEDAGAVLLSDVNKGWIIAMRDGWALRGHKACNDRLTVLQNALAPAIEDDRIKSDPFAKVERARRPHDAPEPNPAWTDAEVGAGIELAVRRKNPGLARAIALGRWGGFRRGTICAIPLNARSWAQDDDGAPERRLIWLTEKRRVLCDKREDPRLTALLDETPNRALTVAYNADGLPWKPRQLNQAMDRLMTAAARQGRARALLGVEGEVSGTPLTIHGLRHARGVELADGGASDAEIMAQLEHATARAAQIYRRQAERRRLADHAQDRVDQAISLKAERAKRARGGE